MSATRVFLLAFLLFAQAYSQKTNTGNNVNELLQECYNTTYLNEKESRLPLSLPILLDLIRRVEDSKGSQDARVISASLLHRFRQDGIVKLSSKNYLSLPFSPNGYQADKNKILLTTFIPGDITLFPEDSLTPLQKCSLHFILSNKFELSKRGDEDKVCKRLGRYRMRIKRATGDIELLTANNTEVERVNRGPIPRGYGQTEISDCPVENGVIYTPWGSIQAGTMLAGISSGFENQKVTNNDFNSQSVFAVTLAGDIAETALQQGVIEDSYNVGLMGDWVSVFVPRSYLVHGRNNQMTDAEIRAGLDGLIMGKKVTDWKSKFSNLKLSQIIDSYYSSRGVFSSKFKACNRNSEATTYITKEILQQETLGFASWYNENSRVQGTVIPENLPAIITPAVDAFLSYYATTASKLCEDNYPLEKIIAEVTIVLDTDWPYEMIQPVLAHILEMVDTNKYESNYTLISGVGEAIVNSSHSLVDFHELYNATVHKQQTTGFNVIEVMPIIENGLKFNLEMEKKLRKTSGKSQIVLFVPYLKSIPSDTSNFLQQRYTSLYKDYYPDVKFLVLGSGNRESYAGLVTNPTDDIFTIPDNYNREDELTDKLLLMKKRIAEIPRRITNPKCGGYMSATDINSDAVELYAEPGTISYFKVSPNYFHGDGDHSVKVRVQSDTLTICSSRSETRPTESGNNAECKRVVSSGEEVIDLSNTCTGGLSSCSPLYISVEAPLINNTNPRCSDPGCRFPDNIKYTIATENFVCRSSDAPHFLGSAFLLISMLFVLLP